jgi:hypothetical protein
MARVLNGLGQQRRLRVIAVLLAFVLLSLPALIDVVGWWVLAGIAGGAALLGLAKLSEFCRSLAEVIGAIAVPWLSLLGFNYLWHQIPGRELRPSLELGLVIAGVVFALAAAAYLLVWRERKWAVPVVAIALAAANVVGLPLLITAPTRESSVAAAQPVVSQLDVALVVPKPRHASRQRQAQVEASPTQPGFDVRYSVARAGPAATDWLLLDSGDPEAVRSAALGEGAALPGAPTLRSGADHVVVLAPDGTPPLRSNGAGLPSREGTKGEVSRWLELAARIAPGASVAVLLQSEDQDRLARWARRVEPRGGAVASVQQLGTTSVTDAALALAIQAPTSSEELSLALRFRPVLLFDKSARLDTPLDIDAFFASGRVDLCHDDQLSGSRCAPLLRASDLINGRTHLRIRRGSTSEEPPSSIYVHPREVKAGNRHLVLLDYWWYLDNNPASVGKGTSCGVGLALPGKTCFDHQSDWEGMTVVVDRNAGDPKPVAVQYAQHAAVVRYGFAELQQYWRDRLANDAPWRDPRLRRNLPPIEELERRPLAFVARGTHATYRGICSADCRQVATSLKENSHNGLRAWPANDTAECIATRCLRLLPTRHSGREPALWNAYDGVWGDRRCILRGAYCTAELSPGSPATQRRYRNPMAVSGYVDTERRFHACGTEHAPCPPLPSP